MAKTKEENLAIQLGEAVELYPCLYNFKIPEYARRDITEKAWSKVAEEVKETGNGIGFGKFKPSLSIQRPIFEGMGLFSAAISAIDIFGAAGILQNNEALRKMIRRKRNEVNSAPAAPIDLKTLQLPEIYKTYSPNDEINEQFLLADSGQESDRVLIFGRLSGLKILKNSRTWYCDGTFRIAPLLFSQVYVILAEALGGVHPIMYALLPSKKASVYEKLLIMLKTLEPDLNPDSISCDFELAAFTAIKDAFPNVQIFGCYFHLCQNFRSKLGELHLISRYKNEPEFCIQVKSIIALAFVPISDLDDALDILSESLPEELIDVLDWFEDFYIGRKNRSREGRRPARFSPAMWNLYERVLTNKDRTNNHAEAANRRLNQLMANKPTIWAFISTLRKIQAGTDTQYEHLVTGNSPRKKLKKFRDTDNRIYKLVDKYDKNDIPTFIRGISNNISLK
ncbi:hypothetical protein QTP88_022427 [Uroleucon formosanum]